MTQKLRRVFTVAGEEGDPLSLLFTSFVEGDDVTSEDVMRDIAQDPKFHEIMEGGAVLIPLDHGSSPVLLATTDVDSYATDLLETAEKDSVVTVFDPVSGVKTLNLYDTYYACSLPHKHILGCPGCARQSFPKSKECAVKKLSARYYDSNESWAPEDVVESYKSRKTRIADFTYISPRLTADEHFAKALRPIQHHDFEYVDERSESVRKGLKERGRLRKFKDQECLSCMAQGACHGIRNQATGRMLRRATVSEHQVRGCAGRYASSEKEAAKEILSRVEIPFTLPQMKFLLQHSGPMHVTSPQGLRVKRFERRIQYLTFRMDWRTLKFGACSRTAGAFTPFKDFKEAKSVIEELNLVTNRQQVPNLTEVLRARIVELAALDYSPTYRGPWRSTSYPALAVEPMGYCVDTLQLSFIQGTKRTVLPWSLKCNHLREIYGVYETLHHLEKRPSKLNRRNVHGYN